MRRRARVLSALVFTGTAGLLAFAPAAHAQLLRGDVLVVDFEAGTSGNGALFRVSRATRARTLLSEFGDPATEPTGASPFGIAIADVNTILVIDNQGGIGGNGALFNVHPTTGIRTLISDFGDVTRGPTGIDPVRIALVAGETLVTDIDAGTAERGAVFKVNRATGQRMLLSDFGDPATGPLGKEPTGSARGARGVILIIDPDAGTNENGTLFTVNAATGVRTLPERLQRW